MFRVCIIGCGMIAKNAHIPAYKSYPHIYEIVGVCDAFERSAKVVAEENGIENYYADAEDMLKNLKPDLVSVCVPNMLHKEYTMLALEYGANVLCEKPLAFTYKDAKGMFDFAKVQGKNLMACQSLRFLPERQRAIELVKKGEIGNIYYAEISRIRRRGIPAWGKFHIKEYSGGGALIDIGIHAIDSAIWLMGNPKPISVFSDIKKIHTDEFGSLKSSGALKENVNTCGFNPEEINVESFSTGIVRFENNAILNFKVAWAANLKEENNIILAGEKCGVDLENKKIYRGSSDISELDIEPNAFENEPFYGHYCLVKNMSEVLEKKTEPFVKPLETLNTTAVLEAAYISGKENREVKMEEIING